MPQAVGIRPLPNTWAGRRWPPGTPSSRSTFPAGCRWPHGSGSSWPLPPTSRPPPSTSSPTSSRRSRSRESFQRLQRNRKNWDILAKTNILEELHNFRNWSHNTEGQLKESEHQTRSGWNSNCKAHLPNCGLIGGSILAATSIFKVRKLVGISRLIEMTRKWLQSHAKRRG